MLIFCPSCSTSYQVDASLLGAAGRSVRCVRCRRIWFAHDPTALAAIAQAHRADVSALTGLFSTADPGDCLLRSRRMIRSGRNPAHEIRWPAF